MQSETPEDERNRVPRHAPVCFCVSEDLGGGERRAWGGPEEGGLAHMLPLHMPGGGPENTTQNMVHGGIIY